MIEKIKIVGIKHERTVRGGVDIHAGHVCYRARYRRSVTAARARAIGSGRASTARRLRPIPIIKNL